MADPTNNAGEWWHKKVEESISGTNIGANARKLKKEMQIELVERLMIRGVTSALDIQDILAKNDPPIKLTTRTIYHYKGIIHRRTRAEIDKKIGLSKTVDEMAYEIKKNFEEVTRELWQQYHSGFAKPSTKVQALKEIRETTQKFAEILQSMGLVHQAPVKHQMLDKDGNPIDPPGSTSKDQMNAEFIAFVKAKFQDPVGSEKQATQNEVSSNATPLPANIKPVN